MNDLGVCRGQMFKHLLSSIYIDYATILWTIELESDKKINISAF